MQIFQKDTDRIPELPLGDITAYQLTCEGPEYEGPYELRVSDDHLHGCRILRRWIVPESDLSAARELLSSIKTYGHWGLGLKCYFPGFAFTFGESPSALDVLVCLDCRWVVFHQGSQSVSLAPTDQGLARLREIYQTVIEKAPGSSA